jgi:hypothetical protein
MTTTPESAAPLTTPKAIVAAAASETAAPPWLRQVAMVTGVLAALGAFLTVRSTTLSNDAIYNSTRATLLQAQASDAWAEYQADSIKAKIVETQLNVLPTGHPGREVLEAQGKDFRARQPAKETDAKNLEHERDVRLDHGQQLLGEKDIVGYAGMAGQFAIALASVAALTRRRPAYYAAVFVGLVAFGVTGYAVVMHYFFMKA